MTQKLIVLGTGGNCVDIVDTVREINARAHRCVYDCVGFLDDEPTRQGTRVANLPVLGTLGDAHMYTDCRFVNGIGSSSSFRRKRYIIAKAGMPDERFATIVHPTASVSSLAVLGPGTVILQLATVASNVRVGRHVIQLPSSVVSHDCVVGDYSCIAGGVCISGGVSIGESCYIGTNAAIIENVNVGRCSLVGMGAVVLHDVRENSVVVGNPARHLREGAA
ncbi:MAG: acetyltransferase [Thermoanaerobaculia bacterium]|nr:acetyltransferase [Thermoanaerobaculia bacterium]